MKRLWTRFLRSAYRKEPISSFILTVGTVDAVIGGVDGRGSLLALGLGTISIAVVLRWWVLQQRQIEPIDAPPIRYLTAQSSRPSLPLLTNDRQRD
ncbi:MAG: hypothetical protein Kow00121_45870 [Elainellaceae cyanobacterium]